VSKDPFLLLRSPAPEVSSEDASKLLDDRYGLTGQLKRLTSERDQNFLLAANDGRYYVLKIANPAESAAITDFQVSALEHIRRTEETFPAPRMVASRTGELIVNVDHGDSMIRARVLSWLDGTPLDEFAGEVNIAAQAGECLAELNRLLKSFSHIASNYSLAWDLRSGGDLTDLLQYVDDGDLRDACDVRLERFTSEIKPRLERCRSQVIYNDLNPSNILVDANDPSRLAGVIDFGDMVYSNLINDVAVAAAYLCVDGDDPFVNIPDFLAAYTRSTPLTEAEVELLPDLILMRHLTTVMITLWRAAMYPENRNYILRNEPQARTMLTKVAGLSLNETIARFLDSSQVSTRTRR
jgi:Ser/Thr protein kinase RdoA (MazF antagonist)